MLNPAASPSLAEQVEREVSACIGCHDCLLACPLPEASLVGIAELNAAVHAPVIRAPNVIQFLTECTQCRQCVPVCPADLSRADMVLWNKMKVEDATADRQLLIQAGAEVVTSSFTLTSLASELASIRLFAGVPLADLRRMALSVTLRKLERGEPLCGEGQFHERLVVVLSGGLEQRSSAGAKVGVAILTLGPGSFFGEMAILADQPEPFAVSARVPSLVVEIPKASVFRLMNGAPAFQETMRALHARRAIFGCLEKPSALGGLPPAALNELLATATLVPLKAEQILFREGESPTDVYLVRSGFLRVTRKAPLQAGAPTSPSGPSPPNSAAHPDEVLVYFREGDVFGVIPLLRGERGHVFSVRAVSRVEVVRIAGATFRTVAQKYPETHALLANLSTEHIARTQGFHPHANPHKESIGTAQAESRAPALPTKSPHTPPAREKSAHKSPTNTPQITGVQALSWDVLVEQGVVQGREILVIDQTRCTHCNGCVDACGRRHGQSRLELRGLQVETLLFPTACRHCDDPVCLLCSVNGIVRRPGGEIAIVEEQCIGCGACAERCPYGNIRMFPVEPPSRGIFRRFLDYLLGPTPSPSIETNDPSVPRKAVKCDLCEGHDDYACVTACPVGAAFRMDPTTTFADGDVFAALRGRQ